MMQIERRSMHQASDYALVGFLYLYKVKVESSEFPSLSNLLFQDSKRLKGFS